MTLRSAARWAVLLWLSLASGPADAFGTITLLGQHAEHARITRLGLAGAGFGPRTMQVLAGGGGRFGAVGAPDWPGRGLMSDRPSHCDGADVDDTRPQLVECRALILAQMALAAEAAGQMVDAQGQTIASQTPDAARCRFKGEVASPARCRALEALGRALHASQDFYSHSNWVDVPDPAAPVGPDNPPGVGAGGRAPFLASATQPMPDGLFTGCYDGFPESRHCKGRVRHAALNKDNGHIVGAGPGSVGTTARGRVADNFARAVGAAVEDTAWRWTWLEERVRETHDAATGDLILCLLRSDLPSACKRR